MAEEQVANDAAKPSEPTANISQLEGIVDAQAQEDNVPQIEHDVSGDTHEIEHVINLAKTNPAVAAMPEFQDLMNTVQKTREGNPTPAPTENKTPETIETPDTTTENKEGGGEFNKGVTPEDLDGDVFGLNTKGEEKTYNLNVNDEMKDFLANKYSIDNVDKFINSVDKWRNDSQKFTEADTAYKSLVDGLTKLPDPIKAAVDAWANAEDFTQAFNETGGGLDFSENFNNYSKEELVAHYYQDKYDDLVEQLDSETMDEESFNGKINDLHYTTQRLYEQDKDTHKNYRGNMEAQHTQQQTAIKESANASVNSLSQTYPNFSKSELSKVRARLVNNDIGSLFYDDNGMFKADAAERLALAIYGDKVLENLTQRARLEGKSSATEEFVGRSKDTMRASKTTGTGGKQQAIDAIKHLGFAFKNDPYS